MSQRSAGTSRMASTALVEQSPRSLRIVGAAGEAAADADDRDRFAGALRVASSSRVSSSASSARRLGESFAMRSRKSLMGGSGRSCPDARSASCRSTSSSVRSSIEATRLVAAAQRPAGATAAPSTRRGSRHPNTSLQEGRSARRGSGSRTAAWPAAASPAAVAEGVAQLHGQQRIESQVAERHPGSIGRDGSMPSARSARSRTNVHQRARRWAGGARSSARATTGLGRRRANLAGLGCARG